MQLTDLLRPELVFTGLESTDGSGLLREMADRIAAAGVVSDADVLHDNLLEREGLGSTAIGGGVAIPHCKLPGIDEVIIAVGLVPDGVDLGAPDGEAVDVIFLAISPPDAPALHLQCLATLSHWIRQDGNVDRLRTSATRDEVCRCVEAPSA